MKTTTQIHYKATIPKDRIITALKNVLKILEKDKRKIVRGFHVCINSSVAQIDIYWD